MRAFLPRYVVFATLLTAAASCASEIDYGQCPQYLACAEATETPMATLEAEYGEDGLCWDNNEDEQVLCRAACEDALTTRALAYPDEDACAEPSSPGEEEGSCEGEIEGTGTSVGDVSTDFALEDANGDTVHLYDFCAQVVILVLDAGWNIGYPEIGPTEYFAPLLESLHDEHGDDLAIIALVGEDEDGSDPDGEDLESYETRLGFDATVLADPGWEVGWSYGDPTSIPSFSLLGPGLVIEYADDEDAIDEDNVADAVARLD